MLTLLFTIFMIVWLSLAIGGTLVGEDDKLKKQKVNYGSNIYKYYANDSIFSCFFVLIFNYSYYRSYCIYSFF